MLVLIAGLHDTAADVRMLESMGVEGHVLPIGIAELKGELTRLEPASVDTVRIGPLSSAEAVAAMGDFLGRCAAPVVLQPESAVEADPETADALREVLLPRTTLVVVTAMEVAALLGVPMQDRVDMRRAGRTLAHLGARAALLRGPREDLLWADNRDHWRSLSSVHLRAAAILAAGWMARGQSIFGAIEKSL